jgi:hypothetical protein
MRNLLILSLLLTGPLTVHAKPAALTSKDGSFSFQPREAYKLVDNPSDSNQLSLIFPGSKSMVVITGNRPVQKTAAQLVKSLPGEAPWKVSSCRLGKVGNQPAAVLEATGVMKKMPNYQTVMAIVPSPKRMYVFQVHYAQGKASTYEAWFRDVRWK